jgi:hypothetical protein
MPAVTFTNSLQGGNTADSTTGYTTASWTPAANKLHLLAIYATKQTGTAAALDTPTGNGITWTLVRTTILSNRVMALYTGSNASPTTGAITFTTSGVNHIGATWTVSTADNADLTTPIVQSVGNSGTATSGTVTLGTFADATNNATFGTFGAVVNVAATVGTGFTGVGTQNQGSPATTHLSEYVTGQDTSVDASWGSSVAWIGIAAEVKMATVSNSAPTISPNTADAYAFGTDTTPTLEFTGSDADSDTLRYNIQVDTVNTFNSVGGATPIIDKVSNVDTGFIDVTDGADTDPFDAGDTISYTVQAGGASTIALDAQAGLIENGYAVGGARTWNHTVAGTNRMLVVSVELWQDVAGTGTITALTYNGVAMTKSQGTTTGAMRAEIWYLASPATGTNVVSATVTGDTDDRKFRSTSWTGVSSTLDASGTGTGGTGNPSVSITTVAANAMIVDAAAKFGTTAFTVGAGQTSVMNDTTGSTTGVASYKSQASAGSTTMSWTNASANDWSAVALSLAPATTTGLTTGTYYWRARAIDPSGSNTYSSWTTVRSFTINTAGGTSTQGMLMMFM